VHGGQALAQAARPDIVPAVAGCLCELWVRVGQSSKFVLSRVTFKHVLVLRTAPFRSTASPSNSHGRSYPR
jgi:hypothetical protein